MNEDIIKDILKEYDYFLEEYNHFIIKDEKYSLNSIILKLLNKNFNKLIKTSSLSNLNHKFFYDNNLYIDVDKLMSLFNEYLDEKFKRNYPRYIDICLNKYKNVYINIITYKNCLKEIEKNYIIKNIKKIYKDGLEGHYGYILEI